MSAFRFCLGNSCFQLSKFQLLILRRFHGAAFVRTGGGVFKNKFPDGWLPR